MSGRAIIQRVLQFKGRRFPLRLEEGFWTALDRIAGQQGRRLNAIVADLANEDPPPVNLAGAVREFAVTDLLRQVGRATATSGATSVDQILNICPSPGMLLDADRAIIDCNEAFCDWSHARHAAILGQRLEEFLRCDFRSLKKGWPMLLDGSVEQLRIPVVFISPGRLISAQAAIFPVIPPSSREDGYRTSPAVYLVWIVSKK